MPTNANAQRQAAPGKVIACTIFLPFAEAQAGYNARTPTGYTFRLFACGDSASEGGNRLTDNLRGAPRLNISINRGRVWDGSFSG